MSPRDFTTSLRTFETDPVAARVLAALPEAELATVAGSIVAADPYGEMTSLRTAVAKIGLSDTAVGDFVEHQLWCTWRQALGRADKPQWRKPITFRNPQHLLETEGHPTILIAPMTISLLDASEVLRIISQQFANQRPAVSYGEGLAADELPDGAGVGLSAARRIASCLSRNGLYCSYADFVYAGHPGIETKVFGTRRPISSSLAGMASRRGTMLLPGVVKREAQALSIEFGEPTLVAYESDGSTGSSDTPPWAKVAIAELIARMLETLIRQAGHQWLLLPTLTFDTPQMAKNLANTVA